MTLDSSRVNKTDGIELENVKERLRHISILYVNIFPVAQGDDGVLKFLLLKRKKEVVLSSVWQPVSGKIKVGERIRDAFFRQVKDKTGVQEADMYRSDVINLYYDEFYDAVLAVPFAFCVFSSTLSVTLRSDLHDEYRWVAINEAIELIPFKIQRQFIQDIQEWWENPLRPRSQFSLLNYSTL